MTQVERDAAGGVHGVVGRPGGHVHPAEHLPLVVDEVDHGQGGLGEGRRQPRDPVEGGLGLDRVEVEHPEPVHPLLARGTLIFG
jgi:hypothetical protein